MTRTRNLLAALAAFAVLPSCTVGDASSRTTSSTPRTEAPSATADYTVVDETHLNGPGRWALRSNDPRAPLAVFTVPAGYQARESYIWTHDERDLALQQGQILYRAPTRVLRDPCDADAPSLPMGRSVEGLAGALMLQKRTTATRPTPVTLGGHRGLYLEVSLSQAAFDACGEGALLWVAGADERALDFPATDRYWILDVDGHPVVVTAMTPIGARGESVKRVTDVAEAVRFVEPTP